MAIGSGRISGGNDAPSTGLKTGSKSGGVAAIDKDTSGGIFSGLLAVRKDKSLLKERNNANDQHSADLWERYKQGTPGARQELLQSLSPTIDAAINNMVGGDRRYLTRARIIANQSLDGFDPNHGATLSTYIYNRLQSLRRLAADRGNFIHVPEKSALERKQLEEIKQDYMLETGTEPSLAMLADRSGMPLNKVGRLMSIFGTTSTSAVRGEHGDSLAPKKRDANELYIDTFYNELPEIDKKIYEWSTGYRGSAKLDRATMARRLNISEAAISQHASKIDRQAAKFNQALERSLYGRDDAD